jgi:hypothetical protein
MGEMASADEVSTKMKMLFTNMEKRAQEVSMSGNYKCTVGTLTPDFRFKEDKRVPSVTRYCIPSGIVQLSFEPSQQEVEAYEAWKTSLKPYEGNS